MLLSGVRHVGEELGLVLRRQRQLRRLALDFHVALGELLGLLLQLLVRLLQLLLPVLELTRELLRLLEE